MNESNIEDLARRAGFLSDVDEQAGRIGHRGGLWGVAAAVAAALRSMLGRVAG